MIERTAAVVFWEIVNETDRRRKLMLVEEFNQLREEEEFENWCDGQRSITEALGLRESPYDSEYDVQRAIRKAAAELPDVPKLRARFERQMRALPKARAEKIKKKRKSDERIAAEKCAEHEWASKPHLSVNAVAEIIHRDAVKNRSVRTISDWIKQSKPKKAVS